MKPPALCVCLALLMLLPTAGPAQWDAEDYTPEFSYTRQPTFSMFYGLGSSSLDGLTQPLAGPGALEVRLGGMRFRWKDEESGIMKSQSEYATVSSVSPRLSSSPEAGEIAADLWQFGLGAERGLGYGSDPIHGTAVIFTNSGVLNWSDFQAGEIADTAARERMERFEESLRFGNATEAGVKVRLNRLLVVEGAFQRSLIFPRHLFAKWTGSVLIELVAQGLLDGFIGEVLESTPEAAPVVAFVLKNGLSYGFYELRKGKMYWPFPSEAPYLTDTFKIGLTLAF